MAQLRQQTGQAIQQIRGAQPWAVLLRLMDQVPLLAPLILHQGVPPVLLFPRLLPQTQEEPLLIRQMSVGELLLHRPILPTGHRLALLALLQEAAQAELIRGALHAHL